MFAVHYDKKDKPKLEEIKDNKVRKIKINKNRKICKFNLMRRISIYQKKTMKRSNKLK